MKVVLLLCLVGAALALNTLEEFKAYTTQFNKNYNEEETVYRAKIYFKKLAEIEAHNADSTQSYKKGINQFSDWTAEEFEAWLPLLTTPPSRDGIKIETERDLPADPPANWDWRNEKGVNPIKNQAACGVCWAFGSTAAVETAHFIASKQLISMSESQQVECNKEGGCNECAFKFLKTTAPCTENSFPYECPDSRGCKACTAAMGTVKNYTVITPSNENALKQAVYRQVVAIGIAASGGWQDYKSGIFTGPCPGGRDHSVAIVGYGTANGEDYWTIRNSWTTSWGEQGYMRIRRNVPNTPDGLCLLATDASVPSIN